MSVDMGPFSVTNFDVRTVTLDRLKYATQGRISERFLVGVKPETYIDYVIGEMVFQLHKEVMAQELDQKTFTEKVATREYASWWQHFKDSYFPDWLKKKFPIEYNDKDIEVKFTARFMATYPESTYVFPDEAVVHKIVKR